MSATVFDGFYAVRRAANGFEWAAWWTDGKSVERAKSWTSPDAEGVAPKEDAAMDAADQAIRNARGVKAKSRLVQEKPWVSMPQEPKVCRGKRRRGPRAESEIPHGCRVVIAEFRRTHDRTWICRAWEDGQESACIEREEWGMKNAFVQAMKFVLGDDYDRRGARVRVYLRWPLALEGYPRSFPAVRLESARKDCDGYDTKYVITCESDFDAEVDDDPDTTDEPFTIEEIRFGEDASFAVLGLTSNATEDDVKRAYKKLAYEHHPDRGGNAETFRKVTQAKDNALRMIGA